MAKCSPPHPSHPASTLRENLEQPRAKQVNTVNIAAPRGCAAFLPKGVSADMNRRRKWVLVLVAIALICGAASYPSVKRHVRAVQLLRAMQAEDRSVPPRPGEKVEDLKLPSGVSIPAYLYGPRPNQARLSVVLGHGIHYMGIDEPRLIRFARHLSDRGVRVLTPELSDLADYRISETGVEVLRRSVAYLAQDGEPVGLIGFSFAGGLALLAAEDPATARHLEYVASIGGYHDLGRTLRFLATDHVEGPDGSFERDAHEYGLLVLLYGHVRQLGFGADEKPLTRVLGAWLREDRPTARKAAEDLTTERGRHVYQLLEEGKLTQLSEQVLPILEQRSDELARLSPRGRLSRIRAPLLFLHGAGDTVVPPEETLWADRELREGSSRDHLALATPLLDHVRVDHTAGLYEQWKLVHLVAQLL